VVPFLVPQLLQTRWSSLFQGSLLQNMTAGYGSHIIFDLAIAQVFMQRSLAVCQTSRSSGERRGFRRIL
jgi:hypothetical protein